MLEARWLQLRTALLAYESGQDAAAGAQAVVAAARFLTEQLEAMLAARAQQEEKLTKMLDRHQRKRDGVRGRGRRAAQVKGLSKRAQAKEMALALGVADASVPPAAELATLDLAAAKALLVSRVVVVLASEYAEKEADDEDNAEDDAEDDAEERAIGDAIDNAVAVGELGGGDEDDDGDEQFVGVAKKVVKADDGSLAVEVAYPDKSTEKWQLAEFVDRMRPLFEYTRDQLLKYTLKSPLQVR